MRDEVKCEVIAKEDVTAGPDGRRSFLKTMMLGVGGLTASTVTGCANSPAAESSVSSTVSASTQIPSSAAWKFGIMADSQWYQSDDGRNPFTVAVDIRNKVIQEMIGNNVQFVMHVGDLTSNGHDNQPQDIYGHALFCQALYNAGIGYFTIRGNHEDSANNATALQVAFPQTQTGVHNNSPAAVTGLTNPDASTLPAPTVIGVPFTLGTNFSSPDPWGTGDLKGLSYSFDYKNARFIALDQFTPADIATNIAYNINTSVIAQQPWITKQLQGRTTGSHAFIFSHKGLILPYHKDVLLGSDSSQNSSASDAFLASLANNGVRFLVCGHDHVHDLSIVAASDGKSTPVSQLVASSNSNYNYLPRNPAVFPGDVLNDSYNPVPRRTVVSQETNTLGYYIVTVDGNNVTFEFYSAPSYQVLDPSQHQWDYSASTSVPVVPPLNFTLRETFGYSLVGKQFPIAFNGSFTAIKDTSPNGTVASLLSGSNAVQGTDYSGLQYTRLVRTGWATGQGAQISDVLYLWGLHSGLASPQSETFTLQMSCPASSASAKPYLASLGDSGAWVNAASANYGGSTKFVQGPWNASYPLGTYGYDSSANVAWAVLNYEGIFAVTVTS